MGIRAWRKLNRAIAGERRAAANQTDNWACRTAEDIVPAHDTVVGQNLDLVNMTTSARVRCTGTRHPGSARRFSSPPTYRGA
jgi:hypothetical protein